jgi:hypothetical protein
MSHAGAGAPAGEPGAPAGADAPAGQRAADVGETVAVLADDLIWATRLVGQLRTLGAAPIRAGTAEAFAAVLASERRRTPSST